MTCNLSGDTNFVYYLILISSLYIPLIVYSLLKLKSRGLDKNNTIKFIFTIVFLSLIFTYISKMFFDINNIKYYLYFFLIFFSSLSIPISFLFFKDKDDLKWILLFFISFLGVSIVLPTFIEPLIAFLAIVL